MADGTGAGRELTNAESASFVASGLGRSWDELIRTLHGGLAILGDDWHLAFVSDQFVAATGLSAGELAGRDVRDIFPAFADEDRSVPLDEVEARRPVRADQRIVGEDGSVRWAAVSLVFCPALGDGLRAVVYVRDTTSANLAMHTRRRAMIRLTSVEAEEHQRVSREIHDGPIQLLTALSFQLGQEEVADGTRAVRESLGSVASELRDVLAEFAPRDHEPTALSSVERWISPLLIGSRIDLAFDDSTALPPDRAVTQAIFVFVYELVRAVRHLGGRDHRLRVSLADERGGYRLLLQNAPSGGGPLQNRAAAQYRALSEFARSVGGSIFMEVMGDTRTISIWLPEIVDAQLDGAADPADSDDRSDTSRGCWVVPADGSNPPELSAKGWEDLAAALPEPITEFSRDLKFSSVNPAYASMNGPAAAEFTGRSLQDVFAAGGDVSALEPILRKLVGGESARLEWQRNDTLGEPRFVRLSATPRFDEDGEFDGVLVTVNDLSDLHILERLHESALNDFSYARRRATTSSVQRLQEPLQAMDELIRRLREFEKTAERSNVVAATRQQLEAVVPRVRTSVNLLGEVDLADGDLGRAIAESLGSLVDDIELVFEDGASVDLSPGQVEALFRIAREAVANSVIHGRASVVTIEQEDRRGGISISIGDDGVGIELENLRMAQDHLGVRSMVERAREQSGNCRIEPRDSGGTLVTVWLPFDVDPR